MKLRFEQETFKDTKARTRATGLLESLEYAIERTWPAAQGFKDCDVSEDWAMDAVKLKQTLIIAPSDYRIHYCAPGTPLDGSWMVGEDARGLRVQDEVAQSKRVAICLFPALAEQEPVPVPKHIVVREIMVDHKEFFPTVAEIHAFDPKKVVAKAVVLVVWVGGIFRGQFARRFERWRRSACTTFCYLGPFLFRPSQLLIS